MLKNLNEKIKNKIDEYLQLDTQLIFNKTDYCEIFGGAVRDSIADDNINDVDFLCLSESSKTLINILKNNNYKVIDKLNGKELQDIYKDIHCIFEPITLINNNFKVVQIIRPTPYNINFNINLNSFTESFFSLLREVDISCCGVSYDGRVRENVSNSILHCLCKVFEEKNQSKMYHPDRYYIRSEKLISRGWLELKYINDEKKKQYNKYLKIMNRDRKLSKLN
jgi:hypothetical protein